ncbi:hypothetical protein MMC21_007045 [Puttea exsequens]|nr:hypothetical protein [Puttea exsequens]
MQYTNFLVFLLTTPALLPLILAAPTPLPANSLKERTGTSDGFEFVGRPIRDGGLRPHAQAGAEGILPDVNHKRQVAIADDVAQPQTPNTDTNPPPAPPPAPGNGHGVPGNSGTGPGTNTNDGGLTPQQQRQQSNRIEAGIAHDDTHKKRQVAIADDVAQPQTPNTDTNPPPAPPPAPGNGHGVPGNSGTGPGTNTNDGGLTPEQQRQQGNRIQAGIAHDDTHKKRQVPIADVVAQGSTPNTDTNPPPPPPQSAGNGHATPGNGASNPGTNSDGLPPLQQERQEQHFQAGIAHDDTH